MATITIKDLPDNADLDRKAMRDIIGGARYRTQASARRAGPTRGTRIVDLRTGAVCSAPTPAKAKDKQPR